MHYSREQALEKIREFLAGKQRDDETTCQTVARLGIFCRGYDQWDLEQLRELYPWLARRVPEDASREEFLKMVVAWDGARALVNKASTTCDVHMLDHDGCLGFDRFNNDQLRELFPQVFAEDDVIEKW